MIINYIYRSHLPKEIESKMLISGNSTKNFLLDEIKVFRSLFVLIVTCATLSQGFIVEPLGLSGAYIPFGNYAKAGKAGPGVSWSKNLDAELQLR